MKVKFQNTIFLSGFSSTKSIGTERGYIDDCTYFVPKRQHQTLIDVLAKQPKFDKACTNFQLFNDDTKHKAFRKFDTCPHFIQVAEDKDLASFSDDLAQAGMTELSQLIINEWLPKGVDSIHYTTANVVYVSEPNDE